MIKSLIIDHDLKERNRLRGFLSQYPFINVCAAFESNEEACQFPLKDIHAIFSDSSRDKLMKGLASHAEPPPDFFSIVSDGESAFSALKNDECYIILKPYRRLQIASCVENLRRKMILSTVLKAVTPQLITPLSEEIKVPGRSFPLLLKLANVAAIQALGDYSQLIDDKGAAHLVRRTMREWTKMLEHTSFFQPDRSIIINLALVVDYQVASRESARVYLNGSNAPLHLGRRGLLRMNKEYKARPPQF
jgi:DNA-binding LytR/AlgR family response regulator